jgi:hypothetical protein
LSSSRGSGGGDVATGSEDDDFVASHCVLCEFVVRVSTDEVKEVRWCRLLYKG